MKITPEKCRKYAVCRHFSVHVFIPVSGLWKQRTGCRIQLQLFFHDCAKSVNRFAHIGVTADNVDPFQP